MNKKLKMKQYNIIINSEKITITFCWFNGEEGKEFNGGRRGEGREKYFHTILKMKKNKKLN